MKTAEWGSNITTKNVLVIGGAAVLSFLVMLFFLYSIESDQPPATQDEVRAPETFVPPFDPEKAFSMFQMLPDGGVQVVTVKDASDQRQIELIQAYFQDISGKFSSGDFSDAARVHAQDMSWLDDLTAGAKQIDVSYTVLPNGGQIRFTTSDPSLVSAIHRWLMAQVSDWENQASAR
jgi:hypothetical protein